MVKGSTGINTMSEAVTKFDDEADEGPAIDASGHLVESDHSNIIIEVVWDAVYFLVGIAAMTGFGVLVYSV
jgi:hypothetical protein